VVSAPAKVEDDTLALQAGTWVEDLRHDVMHVGPSLLQALQHRRVALLSETRAHAPHLVAEAVALLDADEKALQIGLAAQQMLLESLSACLATYLACDDPACLAPRAPPTSRPGPDALLAMPASVARLGPHATRLRLRSMSAARLGALLQAAEATVAARPLRAPAAARLMLARNVCALATGPFLYHRRDYRLLVASFLRPFGRVRAAGIVSDAAVTTSGLLVVCDSSMLSTTYGRIFTRDGALVGLLPLRAEATTGPAAAAAAAGVALTGARVPVTRLSAPIRDFRPCRVCAAPNNRLWLSDYEKDVVVCIDLNKLGRPAPRPDGGGGGGGRIVVDGASGAGVGVPVPVIDTMVCFFQCTMPSALACLPNGDVAVVYVHKATCMRRVAVYAQPCRGPPRLRISRDQRSATCIAVLSDDEIVVTYANEVVVHSLNDGAILRTIVIADASPLVAIPSSILQTYRADARVTAVREMVLTPEGHLLLFDARVRRHEHRPAWSDMDTRHENYVSVWTPQGQLVAGPALLSAGERAVSVRAVLLHNGYMLYWAEPLGSLQSIEIPLAEVPLATVE
jgi:hypothetical protein